MSLTQGELLTKKPSPSAPTSAVGTGSTVSVDSRRNMSRNISRKISRNMRDIRRAVSLKEPRSLRDRKHASYLPHLTRFLH